MDCWIVIAGGKLQNFAARSYSLTPIVRVFHAPRRIIDHARMTGIPPEHDRSGKPQLTCRGHAPKTRQQFQRVNA